MVKIRYAELPLGLHVATEAGDRCAIVYLKPGLTRAQRKEALTVARRSARFGHGPSLPALDMAFALAADRTRTTARMTISAIRKHPLLLLPLLALVLGVIAAGIVAAAAVLTVPPPASSGQSSGLYQFNIGRLVPPSVSTSPSPGPAPGSGTITPRASAPGYVAAGPGQLTWHHVRVRHGRERLRIHLAAGMPVVAAARLSRGMSMLGRTG